VSSPLTPQQCDDIDAAIAAYRQHPDIGFACCSAHAVADHVPALLATVRHLTERRLTEGEYSAAWHAVEGAAGEEGADPGTILHAVLNRLGIALPGAVEPKAKEQSAEACGKCRTAFDPADTRFDGHARYYLTPYCKRCVDACHDNEIADHRCVICV
jgi:hypothetical protein